MRARPCWKPNWPARGPRAGPGPAAEPAGTAPPPDRGTVPRRRGPGRPGRAGGRSVSTQSGPPAARTGVIHDIGYRHYEGPRLGRAGIIRALGWHSLRSAFGIGRGAKAKIIPVIAFVLICVPAVVNAISLATHGGQVVFYDTYLFQLRVLIMIIFIA